MTQKHSTRKFITVLTLLLACVMSFSLFFFTACKKDSDKKPTETKYTYTEVDDGRILNANFSYGQANTAITAFPSKTFSGWSINTDNSASSSKVDSGVIDVSADGWSNLVKKLYNDNEMKSYVGFTKDDGKTNAENEQDFINKFGQKFTNPGKAITDPSNEAYTRENNVLMINNYLDKQNSSASSNAAYIGTAQKVTSSSKITLEAGKLFEISVWVKTVNLVGNNPNDDYFGANIRLINTFNGVNQTDFKISNIKDTEWTKYSIYVQADKEYACTVTLVLGLGYGNGSNNSLYYTEGTAYFDNVSYREVDVIDSSVNYETFSLDYSSDSVNEKRLSSTDTVKAFKYDMSYSESDTIKNALTEKTFNVDKNHVFSTKVNGEESSINNQNIPTPIIEDNSENTFGSKLLKATVDEGSYTIILDNDGQNFKVGAESYSYISFYIKTESIVGKALRSADTTVFVHDVYGMYDIKSSNSVVDDTKGEWEKFSLLIKNNFDFEREYYLEIVIGPTDLTKVAHQYEMACGIVSITSPLVATNVIPENTENDIAYELLSGNATKTVALYAGYASADSYEETVTNPNYTFTPSNAQFGTIVSEPTDVDEYKGVVSNHQFVKESDNAESKINTRSGKGNNGNYAGLINTKYIENYNSDIKAVLSSALSDVKEDETLQPLMIYNANTDDNYGFIGSPKTIKASSFAKITASIRVTDGATAYVYLVNASNLDKTVMHFVDFKVNTDAGLFNNKDAQIQGNQLKFEIKVTEDMVKNTTDGWVNVEFLVATGVNAKNLRVEVWNGDREGQVKSTGLVLVKDITVTTESGFTKPARWADAHLADGIFANYNFTENDELYAYTRPLTTLEKQYNDEKSDKISYDPSYVWAKYDSKIFASFETLEPVVVDPYASQEKEENNAGCTAKTDPSTFWLSFSTILLAGALFAALIALIIKRIVLKRKRNASDAKSHYKVTSRIKSKKDLKTRKIKDTKEVEETENNEQSVIEEPEEDTNTETSEEKTLDEYVYGDVQNFGNDEEEKND